MFWGLMELGRVLAYFEKTHFTIINVKVPALCVNLCLK